MHTTPEQQLSSSRKHDVPVFSSVRNRVPAAGGLVKAPVLLLGLACLAMLGCKQPGERFAGDEVFGVPARVAAGTTNEKLKSVLPPGVQELDLGMSRDEVAKSRARFFQDTGPASLSKRPFPEASPGGTAIPVRLPSHGPRRGGVQDKKVILDTRAIIVGHQGGAEHVRPSG